MISFFENDEESAYMPNLIIFEVHDCGNTYVVGGYSSVGWTRDTAGDSTCFLFNLTNNLRFNALDKVGEQFSWITD